MFAFILIYVEAISCVTPTGVHTIEALDFP